MNLLLVCFLNWACFTLQPPLSLDFLPPLQFQLTSLVRPDNKKMHCCCACTFLGEADCPLGIRWKQFSKLFDSRRRKGRANFSSPGSHWKVCLFFLHRLHPAWQCLLLIPITKHTAPILLAFVAIWQIHVDTANIHLFRHIMSRNREQLELCLLLLLMRMGKKEGGKRAQEKSFNYIRDIQLIMSHMCLQCQSNPMKFILNLDYFIRCGRQMSPPAPHISACIRGNPCRGDLEIFNWGFFICQGTLKCHLSPGYGQQDGGGD